MSVFDFKAPEIIDWSKRSIRNKNNKYGYVININHPLINDKWNRFIEKWEQGEIETDKPYSYVERRLVFERMIMNSKFYKKRMQQELAMFGQSFEILTGIKPEEI